nr:MAG TPA: hypothetical protein [Caudoviricetes sp.]
MRQNRQKKLHSHLPLIDLRPLIFSQLHLLLMYRRLK